MGFDNLCIYNHNYNQVMSKAKMSGIYLRKSIINFLKGDIEDKKANPFQIKQLIQTSLVDKCLAISIYHQLAHDPNNKMEGIIRLLDKKLIQYTPYPIQIQNQHSFSLPLHVVRLITLLKYNLPYEETVQSLLEHILINQLSEIDLLTLLFLLEYRPVSHSKSLYKLLANILDLLQEHLNRNRASPSFITSVSRSLSKSIFRVPASLKIAVNRAIDQALPFFTFQQLKKLSHQMRQKSLEQWQQLGNFETSLVQKRVLYQYILNKQYPGMQIYNYLPGRPWRTGAQLQEAVRCVKSLGVKEAYIDIFGVEERPYTSPLLGYASLKHPQFINQYIEYIFTYIKHGYSRIDVYSLFKMVRTIRSFFSSAPTNQPSQEYFQKIQKDNNINLINLLVVIYQIGRYNVQQSAQLKSVTKRMFDIVVAAATPEYLQSFSYKEFKTQEMSLIYNFVSCQIVDVLAASKRGDLERDLFKKMEKILLSQKAPKHRVNDYSLLLAFYRYIKSLVDAANFSLGSSDDILLQEELPPHEIKQLLEPYFQINQNYLDNFENSLACFHKKYRILTNVLFQPNLEIKYAIVDKESKQIKTVFEYKRMIYDKLSYEVTQTVLEDNVNITLQGRDLTLFGHWRKKFFNYFYRCQYFYSSHQMEVLQKLHKEIKRLGTE